MGVRSASSLRPFNNFDFLFRQPVQFVHERVDLLVGDLDLALNALACGLALGGAIPIAAVGSL